MGGITGLRKVGALAEAHNRRMEPLPLRLDARCRLRTFTEHAVQAQLRVLRDARTRGASDYAMKDIIEMDTDGYIHAPTGPGLGYEVDWDVIDDETIASF